MMMASVRGWNMYPEDPGWGSTLYMTPPKN